MHAFFLLQNLRMIFALDHRSAVGEYAVAYAVASTQPFEHNDKRRTACPNALDELEALFEARSHLVREGHRNDDPGASVRLSTECTYALVHTETKKQPRSSQRTPLRFSFGHAADCAMRVSAAIQQKIGERTEVISFDVVSGQHALQDAEVEPVGVASRSSAKT